MREDERTSVIHTLTESEAQLLSMLTGLSKTQWRFRESPERWSIAEVLEHLVVFEDFILGAILRALESPAQPEKMLSVPEKEPLVMGLAQSRGTKLQAREATRPAGRWTEEASLVELFQQRRARTIHFASETSSDLRAHFFPHIAFGDLDCFQWLLVIGQHTARHCAQVEEIMRHPAYPGR